MPRGEGGGAGECTADAEINPPPLASSHKLRMKPEMSKLPRIKLEMSLHEDIASHASPAAGIFR